MEDVAKKDDKSKKSKKKVQPRSLVLCCVSAVLLPLSLTLDLDLI